MSQDVTYVEGFQKSNRKLNDQRICNQMVKNGTRLVGMCCEACGQMDRKYKRKLTGSYTDHGKQNKQKECLRSSYNYVMITSLMHYIEDLVI